MSDREVWLVVRRSLLFIIDAFDRKFECGKYGKGKTVTPGPTDTIMVVERSVPNG